MVFLRSAFSQIWLHPSAFILLPSPLTLMLRIFERWLVFPAPRISNADWNPAGLEFEDVYFAADDGTRLHGWFVPHPAPRATVLYCHGNGEHVPRLAERLKVFHEQLQMSVFAWDYRSYGRSQGVPHEDNVIADARAAQLWLAKRAAIDPAEIVLMGRSLGGAVTVALAAQHPNRGLVLDRTFARLTDAAAHNVPWLPVRWIMQNKFDSIDHIQGYRGPLLQMHGTADEVVPFPQGKELFNAAVCDPKHFIEVPDWNHNAPLPDRCLGEIGEFLANMTPAAKVYSSPERL